MSSIDVKRDLLVMAALRYQASLISAQLKPHADSDAEVAYHGDALMNAARDLTLAAQPGQPAPGQAELWAQSHGADSLPADLRRLVTAGFEAGWAACAAKRSF